MQGFKNLVCRPVLADEAVDPLIRKSDDHRKIVQTSLQYFSLITKNIQYSYTAFETEIFELHHQLTQSEAKLPQYYIELTHLFKNVSVQLRMFSEKANGSLKQLNNVCNALFQDYSNTIMTVQQHIRNYQSTEQIAFEMGKRYSRNLKNLLGYLQSYKSSFTDARLIYNNQEKIKRYNMCQSVHKVIMEDFKAINQKCQKLSQKKFKIKQNIKAIDTQMKNVIKVIGNKVVNETKNYIKNFIEYQKTAITFLAEKKFTLEKLKLSSFFQSINNTKNSEYFLCPIKESECLIYPALFVYNNYLNFQYLPFCKSAFVNYYKQANDKVEQRKQINKKILQFLKMYLKIMEKSNYTNLKEINANFQKIKKRISELFGNKFVSFLKSTNAIFELSIGIHEKMIKSLNNKLKNIDLLLTQQNKQMDMFLKQLKSNLEKIDSKKQIKKQDSLNKDKQEKSASVNTSVLIDVDASSTIIDRQKLKQQVKQKSQFLIHLITGFVAKLDGNQKLTKLNINSIIEDLSMSTNQHYSLCCQYQSLYFGKQEYLNNYKKYQNDIDKALDKQSNFILNELNFKSILEDSMPVIFDGQLNKIEEFKKLKKPLSLETKKSTETEFKISEGVQPPLQIQNNNQSRSPPRISSILMGESKVKMSFQQNKIMKQSTVSSKSGEKDKEKDKYRDFIYKKLTFGQDQQFVKSFSCAFYDKIILQGRIYITNERLCFHSKFNSNNVFFGGTFIQIPKNDIKKVQKRYNALVFDNSLAITTVNGEMFFTSFFSRDQAYDVISKSLDLNPEEQFFQPEQDNGQNQNQLNESIELVVQDDDLKQKNEQSRLEEINKLLESFPYQLLLQAQIEVANITAMKFFRLFDSGQQISHNRRTHSSFLYFSKDALGHKQIQVSHFKPNILQFMNTSNIKDNTPIQIQRKLNAMVPIAAAGVPFMPKAARSDETQKLYFISKSKYIIESTIQNSGAPYTDCFNIRLRKTIQSIEENKIKMKVQMHVNFVKSTMMKGMIESKGFEQSKVYFQRTVDEVKKYFKSLEKVRKPVQSSKGNNIVYSVWQEQYQSLRKQNEELLNQKQKMHEEITVLSVKQKNFLKYFIGSLVLNVFLFLLLLS